MIPIKQYIASQFLNRTFHFTCNCVMPLDIIGTVKDYELIGGEIILLVSHKERIIHVGLNAPSLKIEEIE